MKSFSLRTLGRFGVSFMLLFVFGTGEVYAAPPAKRKAFVFKEIEIKGKIQKPEAMYFLSRARFNYKMLDLNVSFLPKVEEAVFKESAF